MERCYPPNCKENVSRITYLASTINCFLLLLLLLCRCILSTDMARHNEILNKFKDILADGFSFENEVHKSMVRHSVVTFSFFHVREN